MTNTLRAILITGLILCSIIAGAYLALPVVQRFIAVLFTEFEKKPIKKPQPSVFPAREEDVASAAKPMAEVLENLNIADEEQNFILFDTVIQSRLRHEAFEDLESYFGQLRIHKTRFPGGNWKEFRFCETLATCYGSREDTERAWESHFIRLERWMKQYPASGIAAAVTAKAWVNYAWEARGSDYADTVSTEGWRLFRERLEKSRQVLEATQEPRTPMWFHTMQIVARGQGWNQDEYEKLFNEAVNLEPLFFGFYTAKAYNLLPRWHGKEGEWQTFATESADRIGGDEGNALYYFITSYMWDFYRDRKYFTEYVVSWPRMKRGFAAAEKLYGLSWWRLNVFCCISGQAMDRQEARKLFDRIGNNWDMNVWKKQYYIDQFRNWLNRAEKFDEKHAE